jgi:hypothetical protein
MLPCGHHGCEACIRHWVAKEKTCPTCRRVVLRGLADISYIDANKTTSSSAAESGGSGSGGGGGAAADPASAAQEDAVRQFGTKPAAVLEYVAMVCD